jgi:hypothetical protein
MMRAMALVYTDRLAEADSVFAELQVVSPDNRDVQAAVEGKLCCPYWLLHADRFRARAAFDRFMVVLRGGVNHVPSWVGFWALLHTLHDDGARADAEVRASPSEVHPSVRICLGLADAAARGRTGHPRQATDTAAAAVGEMSRVHDLLVPRAARLAAEAAVEDG